MTENVLYNCPVLFIRTTDYVWIDIGDILIKVTGNSRVRSAFDSNIDEFEFTLNGRDYECLPTMEGVPDCVAEVCEAWRKKYINRS